MKKMLSIILSLAIAISLVSITDVSAAEEIQALSVAGEFKAWDGSVATSFAGGTGTESDPYIIEDGAQFAYLASKTQGNIPAQEFTKNKYFSLANSIDFNNIELQSVDSFYGTFLGNGYEIRNMNFANGSMFRVNNGTVSGLKLSVTARTTVSYGVLSETNKGVIEFCTLTGEFVSDKNCCVGFCETNRGKIRYCHVKDATFSGGFSLMGALAGYFYDGKIHDCFIENVTISKTSNATSFSPIIGSAVGSMSGYSSIDSVHAKNITMDLDNCTVYNYVGGLIGALYGGTATSSSFEGEINIKSDENNSLEAGGFTGYLGGTALNCYSKVNMTIDEAGGTKAHGYGGFAGTQMTNSAVMKCFSEGSIYLYAPYTENNQINVGGFIGETYSLLTRKNCFADCDVVSYSSEGYAGQFVGDFESTSNIETEECYYNNTKRFYAENTYMQYANGVSDTLDWDFLKNSITLKPYVSEETLENNGNAVWNYFSLSDYPTLYSENRAIYMFAANGGNQAPAGMSVAFENYGVMPENNGKREGYRFCGWNTKADGSGTTYQPGKACSLTGFNTFYAMWEKAKPEGIKILDSNCAMTDVGRIDLTVKITPSDLIDKNVVWTSSDESVATVNEKGQVYGVGEGIATITVSLGEFTDSVRIRIVKKSETSGVCGYDAIFKLDGTTLKIEGEGYLYDDYGWYKWTEFADTVTSIEFGEGIQSVPTYGFENFTKLTSVVLPSTMQVVFKGAFSGCTALKNIYYKGSAEDYKNVGVDVENSYLTNTTVRYLAEGAAPATQVVGLRTQSAEINAETNEINITAFETEKTAGVAIVTEGVSELKKYTTDSGNGITVSSKDGYKYFIAKLTNGNEQSFNIYAEVNGLTYIYKVKVTFIKNNIAVEGVKLDKTSLDLKVDETATFTATVMPENAANKNVTWASSDTSVATVNNGVVTAVGVGTANVMVTTVDGEYTASCTVNVEKVSGSGTEGSPIADIATLRCYETSFNDDTKKITVNVDRFPVINKSGSIGVAIIPADGYKVSYNFTGSNGITAGFSNTNTSKYTLLSTGDNTETTGGGALGNVPMKIFKKENSTRIYVDVVLTKGIQSITYKMTIALRDPAVEGDVDIVGFQPLRAVRKTFNIDNEAKTIYYETEKGVTSAGFAVSVDNDFTKETRPRRLLTAKSGQSLSHGDIKTSGKDIYDRYVVARRSAGTTQTYQVKVHGGEDGMTYTWYTVTVVFK